MAMTYDVQKYRADFPILNERIYGKPLIYLDNGATTQKPQSVIDTYDDIYEHKNANIHRGVHHLSNVCTDLYEQARRTVATHLNAASPDEIIFTRNTTEAINLVAYAYGDSNISNGDEIIVSTMEHHSNIVPWQLLCQRRGATLKVIPINDDGTLNIDAFASLLSPRTKLVSVTHVSNVLGTINDVKEITRMAHSVGALVLIDGAQSVPHTHVDLQDIQCDFFAFSGHKVYAPLGSGALYGRLDLLRQMTPWMGGGEMIDKVSFSGTTFAEPPLKFEAGTPDYAAAIGLASAINYIDNIGINQIEAHEHSLVSRLISGLNSIGGIRLIGQAPAHSSAVSFLIDHVHPYDAGTILDKMGIAVRTGHHCAQPLMEHLGIPGTIRASFALYNTEAEVDALLEGVEKVKSMFA